MSFGARIALPVLFGVLFLLSGPVAALALLPPAKPGAPVVVIGPSASAYIGDAGGRPIGPYSTPFASLAAFDVPTRVTHRSDGVWLLRDGTALAAVCMALLGSFE
ncbi:MAG: hypothetical protein AAGK37_04375 [Pseudomonadota bacterium]